FYPNGETLVYHFFTNIWEMAQRVNHEPCNSIVLPFRNREVVLLIQIVNNGASIDQNIAGQGFLELKLFFWNVILVEHFSDYFLNQVFKRHNSINATVLI